MKHFFLSLLLSCVWLQAAESLITLREKPLRVATSNSAEIFPESWRGGKVAASADSQPTLENDFNAFAARLWTGDAALWQLAKGHPPIQRKLALVLRFYQQLHSTLDEAFSASCHPRHETAPRSLCRSFRLRGRTACAEGGIDLQR